MAQFNALRLSRCPINELGERVCLAVMFQPGKSVPPEEILNDLDNAGLSKYDMPEFFLHVDEIPLTASGKVRKRDIVDWISNGSAKPMAITRQAKPG